MFPLSYLGDDESLQEEFVMLLDSLCQSGGSKILARYAVDWTMITRLTHNSAYISGTRMDYCSFLLWHALLDHAAVCVGVVWSRARLARRAS